MRERLMDTVTAVAIVAFLVLPLVGLVWLVAHLI
jgi:hypothetical protein